LTKDLADNLHCIFKSDSILGGLREMILINEVLKPSALVHLFLKSHNPTSFLF
jgi:hypothetical protein